MQSTDWPVQLNPPQTGPSEEERDIALHTTIHPRLPIIRLNWYSSFTQLKHVSAWILCFIHNCRAHSKSQIDLIRTSPSLTVQELVAAQAYWVSISQKERFPKEMLSRKITHCPTLVVCCPYIPFWTLLTFYVLVVECTTPSWHTLPNI